MVSSQCVALLDRGVLRAAERRQPENAEDREAGGAHQRVVLRDQQVFQHGHAAEQPDILEGAGDPRMMGDQVVRHAFEQEQRALAPHPALRRAGRQRVEMRPDRWIAALQRDAAFGRLVEAGDAVEHRGLAGAVRTDQRGDLAMAGDEGQVVHGDQPAEAHGEMLDAAARHRRDVALIRGLP